MGVLHSRHYRFVNEYHEPENKLDIQGSLNLLNKWAENAFWLRAHSPPYSIPTSTMSCIGLHQSVCFLSPICVFKASDHHGNDYPRSEHVSVLGYNGVIKHKRTQFSALLTSVIALSPSRLWQNLFTLRTNNITLNSSLRHNLQLSVIQYPPYDLGIDVCVSFTWGFIPVFIAVVGYYEYNWAWCLLDVLE